LELGEQGKVVEGEIRAGLGGLDPGIGGETVGGEGGLDLAGGAAGRLAESSPAGPGLLRGKQRHSLLHHREVGTVGVAIGQQQHVQVLPRLVAGRLGSRGALLYSRFA
jgi:hypothetical protein